jgi:hypothetical protein
MILELLNIFYNILALIILLNKIINKSTIKIDFN